ncbi:hypothetical protein [uncultured Roseibium sp.]|uniref:hypothetical protein n=1 Tax=uncultured Roseibium sp. TaxID=1936171 RepID=UPI00259AC7BD|nr:hypothetical protein [uncultured Roseibium sp.]
MKRPIHSSRSTLAAGVWLGAMALAFSAEAFTPSGNQTADAFLELLEAEGRTVESYSSVEESGDTVSILDIQLKDEADADMSASIGKIDLTGAAQLAGGRTKVDALALSDLTMKASDGSLHVASFSSTDMVLPSAAEMAGSDDVPPIAPSYGEVEILDATVTDDEDNQATVERIFIAIDAMDGDLPTASRFNIKGLVLDAETIDDDASETMADLGYEKITVDIEGAGKWDPDAATVIVENLKLTGEDAGTFQIDLKLGGVTRDLVNKLNETQGEPEDALGLIQGVTVETISLKLDNDSIVERVLDKQANEAGMERSEMVAQLEGGLPMMLSMLQNPEFQNKVSAALGSFLQSPETLKVTASPSAPVPVAQLMGTVMMAPHTLPQVLGIDIAANEDN